MTGGFMHHFLLLEVGGERSVTRGNWCDQDIPVANPILCYIFALLVLYTNCKLKQIENDPNTCWAGQR